MALTLEVVDVTELFVELDLDIHDSVAVDRRSRDLRFAVGGFECMTDVTGPPWPVPSFDGIVANNLTVDRDAVLSVSGGAAQHVLLRARGNLRIDIGGSVSFPLSLTGKLGCEKEGGTLTFPFSPPPLALLLALKVPLGFDAEGSFSATGVVYNATGYASLYAFLFAKMKLGSPLTDALDFDIATLKAGVKGDYELAVPVDQVLDPATASSYKVALHGELSPGAGYQNFLKRFGINLEPVPLDPPDDVVLARSPTGTTSASTTTVVAGEPVTVTNALAADTVDFGGAYNVESVRVWRNDSTNGWQEVAELPASTAQTDFAWEWTPTPADEAAGGAEFSAYVETAEAPGVLLEVEPDSRVSLTSGAAEDGFWSAMNCTGNFPCSGYLAEAAQFTGSHDGAGNLHFDVSFCVGTVLPPDGLCDTYTADTILTGSFSSGNFNATFDGFYPPLVGTFHGTQLDLLLTGTVMCKAWSEDFTIQCTNMMSQ